ncbi:MAG: hypothetical protein Pars93KO_01870 [Parasphingorhabdus sp.]
MVKFAGMLRAAIVRNPAQLLQLRYKTMPKAGLWVILETHLVIDMRQIAIPLAMIAIEQLSSR